MKWYSSKKFRPGKTGDQIIFRLKSGYIHVGTFDYQKDRGYFFSTHEDEQIDVHDTTHFCIPDPIEIE